MVLSDINMPRMDGLSLLEKLQEAEEQALDRHRVGLWRHGQHPHRDEPRRLRLPDQADRLCRSRDDDRQDASGTSSCCARRGGGRLAAERAHASLSRYFSPNLAERLAGDADGLDLAGQWREVASLFTDITGFTTLVETLDPSCSARCSTTIWPA